MKTLYLLAGCNGAGKTTAAFTLLPRLVACREFVNADEIVHGLSPFQPETVSIQPGHQKALHPDSLLVIRPNFLVRH